MWDAILSVLSNPTVQQIGANVIGNVIGASLDNESADAERDAIRDANNQSVALARENRDINLALSRPFYQGSGNAFNLLSNIYGLPQQDFRFPTSGAGNGSGALDSQGRPLIANLGAGQPVAGRSGGGGSNAFAGLAGSLAGNFVLPGIGGAIGGAVGGLIRNGGDNWQTLATQAPGGFDYATYMQQPDLAKEWAKPDVQSLFAGNRDAYANWHYNKFGKSEGRTLNPVGGDTITTQPIGGTQLVGQSGNAFSTASRDPMQLFWNSPHGKLATDQFLTIDNPAIKNAFATQGKALSGAQQVALSDRGRAVAGNAFGNYERGIQTLAGYGPQSSSSAQQAGNAFAGTAIGATQNTGAANSAVAGARNNNWRNAFNNATEFGYNAGKEAGWW